jgi:hypothetical protein
MKAFIKYLLNSLKYLAIQGLSEIVVIVILEYAGLRVLSDFSRANLFVENVEDVAWSIGMKTAMFGLFYLPLFIGISALLSRKIIINSFKYSIINAVINIFLFIVYFILRSAEFSEVLNLFIATLLASAIIIALLKIRENKKPQVSTA